MEKLNAWKFGAVLSITSIVNYILCTIIWVAFTEPSISFLNALFHGLDFRKLITDSPFSLSAFLYALVVLAVAAYVLGFIFANVRNWLRPYSRG